MEGLRAISRQDFRLSLGAHCDEVHYTGEPLAIKRTNRHTVYLISEKDMELLLKAKAQGQQERPDNNNTPTTSEE